MSLGEEEKREEGRRTQSHAGMTHPKADATRQTRLLGGLLSEAEGAVLWLGLGGWLPCAKDLGDQTGDDHGAEEEALLALEEVRARRLHLERLDLLAGLEAPKVGLHLDGRRILFVFDRHLLGRRRNGLLRRRLRLWGGEEPLQFLRGTPHAHASVVSASDATNRARREARGASP